MKHAGFRVRLPMLRLLSQGHFAAYTAANGLSLLGTWMQRIACSVVVWNMTHSTIWLGILAAADLMPTVIVGPFGGAVADRWDTLKLNKLCQFLLAVMAALLTLLIHLDLLTLGCLIAVIVMQGCITALGQSARMTIVQELVGRDDVPRAVAINSMKVNLARLVGPALAGVLVVKFDVLWVFLLNAVVTVIFVTVLFRIPLSGQTIDRKVKRNMLVEIGEGLRYVAADPGMRTILLLLLAGGVFIRALAEMLPAFASGFSVEAATGLAVLTSSMAFGSVTAGLTMSIYLKPARLCYQAAVVWLVASFAAIAFALMNSLWAMGLFAIAMGYLSSVGLVATQTYIQLEAPPAVRGRALSVHGLIFRASPSLGALILGFTSDSIGLTIPAIAGALVMIAIALVVMPFTSRLNHPPA